MPTYSAYNADQKLDLINKTRTVLRGEHMPLKDLHKLEKALVVNDQFAYTTEILLQKLKEDATNKIAITVKEHQTLAKYIYKDNSLPAAFKFEKALQYLHTNLNLKNTGDAETLGLAGAIYKRKWQHDHQLKNLILSRYYYRQGYNQWRQYLIADSTKLPTDEKVDDPKEHEDDCTCGPTDNPIKNVENDKRNDNGFTAINYAYICELTAADKLEEFGKNTCFTKKMAEDLDEATAARKFIVDHLDESGNINLAVVNKYKEKKELAADKWVVASIAEAYFGLGQYKEALNYIQDFVGRADTEPWQVRTFNQQMLSIAYLQLMRKKFYKEVKDEQDAKEKATTEDTDDKDPLCIKDLETHTSYINVKKINECLNGFIIGGSGSESIVECCNKGKADNSWGLTLSGGGFRASLFHIGVLAALAEDDRLKDVEVLSCVSGGSIIGAHYYLKLKLLLEAKTDCEIEKQDYINLVKEIETEFIEGVQKNLRMRIFGNIILNLKMLFFKNYSRSHRLGELYERHFFKKILTNKSVLKNEEKYEELLRNNKGKIFMTDLIINPKLSLGEQFNFNTDSWRRKNKVPQLVLNATSVNTGHNWQFTASWMGEPPGNIQSDIDVKPRLRRMYFPDAPKAFKKFRLGYAVAASSCVPVMFRPMPMNGLYHDIELQLIDGGLHDNQGIAALIDAECANMIISDASGQLPTSTASFNNIAAVFYRADSILQERLRELQFKDIKERESTTQLSNLVVLHLKNGCSNNPKAGCTLLTPQGNYLM